MQNCYSPQHFLNLLRFCFPSCDQFGSNKVIKVLYRFGPIWCRQACKKKKESQFLNVLTPSSIFQIKNSFLFFWEEPHFYETKSESLFCANVYMKRSYWSTWLLNTSTSPEQWIFPSDELAIHMQWPFDPEEKSN